MKILVVEDDRAVAQSLQLLLGHYNYAVDIAADGEKALQMADAFEYHLVLLDVLLPRLSGVEVCRQLRKRGFRQPVLLLTGQGETQQKAIALNAGADDYVVKPFDNDELVARIQALLRRGTTTGEAVLTWEHLSLDPNTRRVAYREQLLALTPKEFAILELFLRHQERVLSARAILDQAWSSLESPGEEAVRCHIKDLRQKLAAVGAPKDLIKTVHRVGYRLNLLYASATPQVNQSSSAAQVAELRSVNEELRVAMEQLRSTQAELQQKNQELQAARDALEQRVSERTSDRKQAEARLRESEQKYRSLFESIDQGFCLIEVVFDANDKAIDYRFMEINEAFEQQSGLANAVEKTVLELVPNLEPQWVEFYGQVAKSGESARFEADVPSMNRVFDIYAFPSGPPGQNLVAVLFTDITKRKQAEEILRQTAELNAFRVSLVDALRPLTDASEIQAIAARILGKALRATRVIYIEVMSEGEEVIVHHNYTNGVAELSGRYCLEDYRRNLIADHPDGHTQVVTDIPSNPNYTDAEKARYRELDIAAHIDVPLIKNNQFVALLAVHQSTPRQWTETEIKLVEEAAERTWATVERVCAEAALHQNEEMLRLALTGAHAGTWDWELATGQATWSPETYQMHGLAPTVSPPTYEDWYENILHPDDRTWVTNSIAEVIAQRQPNLQLEFRILHPEQGVRWVLSLAHLTIDPQGEPIRLSGILLDISDRKQAELTLQKQIQQEYLLNDIAQDIRRSLNLNDVLSSTVHRVRAFLEVDRVVIFRFRPDWQGEVIMESVGDAWTPILSTTIFDPCFRDHYIEPYRQGRVATLSDIDTADLEPCYRELLQQFQVKANVVVPVLKNNNLWGLLIAHHCSAPRLWLSAEVAALKRLATQVGIAIQQSELYQQLQLELDERKQAEQTIREQAALLDISTDAILVCDLDCRILYWNQGAEHLYGWQAEEALGQQANELLSRCPSTLVELKHTVLEQGTWHGEIQRVTKTGKEVTVEGRCTLVRDELGQPKSILSIDTDITEKKSLEAQFYQAQRLESLGTLASGIAHDLNNALTPILTIAQLLRMQKTSLDARSQEMLQVLEDSAKRGARMVQQILTFTKGMGGEKRSIDVAALLQEAVSVIQQTFPKSITIHTEIPAPGVKQVSADATQLHQVLINLCVNARDAMPNGGTLTLSVENFEVNEIFAQMHLDAHVGQYVLITVTDTGTGIAPDVRDRIFDPFFTTKALGQGTGLGLATVLGIIRSYGGFIQVVSEVGQGTQFKVYLPVIETETAPHLQQPTLPQGQGELILVIDDEDRILQSTRAILEAHHYQILTARSGTEAIATYAQHQQEIAVVLIDMMMPDMDGIMLIRVLQEMNPQVRAIAVSGLLPQYQNSLEALGITTHLNKPYITEDLLNSIHLQLR